MSDTELALTAAFALAAFLYASVGHAGASGYLAAMALAGMPMATMKPTSLLLNLVVASIALVQFARAGCFTFRLYWPFALGAVPLAFVGGSLPVPGPLYRVLVALGLLVAALRLAIPTRTALADNQPPPWPAAVAIGAIIGLVAGMTGTGGGIYLSPVLLFMRWGDARQTGGIAAAFILTNSLAGLAASPPDLAQLSPLLPLWAVTVATCGAVGAAFGCRRSTPLVFKRLLAAALLVATIKLVAL